MHTLSTYSDDRSKCCLIQYPGDVEVLVSKGVSLWKTLEGCPGTDDLKMTYDVFPVETPTGDVLPFYKYMTESGTPFSVIVNSGSTIMWQGRDFNTALVDSISELLTDPEYYADLIIASYNLASAKKYQGVYFGGYSAAMSGGPVLNVYRTERMPQGKCMRIPRGYLDAIKTCITENPDAVVGLITSTTMLGMVITSEHGGMLVGSSVIPHTINIGGSMVINMDKPEKPNVRFTGTVHAQLCIDRAIERVSPAEPLEGVIPKQGYIREEPIADQEEHLLIVNTDPLHNYTAPVGTIDMTPKVDIPKDKMTLLKEYTATCQQLSEIVQKQQAIINALWEESKYPPMTPDRVAEIEKRTREEMLAKFNSMFK